MPVPLLILLCALALAGCDLVTEPQPTTTSAESEPEPEPPLPPLPELVCNTGPAERAVLESGFAERIAATAKARLVLAGESETGARGVRFEPDGPYAVATLECADLTGDGVEEMIVGLSAGKSDRIGDWAIFTPSPKGVWALALGLEGARVDELGVEGEKVRFTTPGRGGEERKGKASFDGEEFIVDVPGSSGRGIEIADGALTRLGRLEAQSAGPGEATELYGPPTSVRREGTLCELRWDDLGLTINFADFGTGDPCGPGGSVGAIELLGGWAAAAGWSTSKGISVGSRTAAVRKAYPGARRRQGELVLVERRSPIGASARTPTLTAVTLAERVLLLRLFVGAAGD